MTMLGRVALAIAAAFICLDSAPAQDYTRDNLRIPASGAGSSGLEALMVKPAAPGRYPLMLINHGSPRNADNRKATSPTNYLPQATEFARRGWAAVVVLRRGYGDSGGDFAEGIGACNNPDYVKAGSASVADLRAAIAHLSNRPDIDPMRIVSAGHSAGGFATVALTADPPNGLVAGINFAGGRGSQSDEEVCQEERLIEAMRQFGQRSRLPMLWIYAENDKFFGPALARKMRDAFVGAGGKVEFVAAPAFGRDGHTLFAQGIPQWTPAVDQFLKAQRLAPRDGLLPPQQSALKTPAGLSSSGREAFEKYRAAAPHKAFAAAPDGSFGWRSGQRNASAAKDAALEVCGQHANNCRLLAVDDGSP